VFDIHVLFCIISWDWCCKRVSSPGPFGDRQIRNMKCIDWFPNEYIAGSFGVVLRYVVCRMLCFPALRKEVLCWFDDSSCCTVC
jgi:hypothetical protein